MKPIQILLLTSFTIFNFIDCSSEKPKPNLEQLLSRCRQKCSAQATKSSTHEGTLCYSTLFPNNTNPYCLKRYQHCLARCNSRFQPKEVVVQPAAPVVTKSRYFMDLYP